MICRRLLWICCITSAYVAGNQPSMKGYVHKGMSYNATGSALVRLAMKNKLLCAAQCANQFISCNTAVFDSSIVPQCLLFSETVISANLIVSSNTVVYDFQQSKLKATMSSFRWNTTGITVAGWSNATGGTAESQLKQPYGLALDSANSLYIVDFNNNRIQKWLTNATSGTTVAGLANGTSGAGSTALRSPVSVVLDSNDNMYFTDKFNERVMFWARNASSGTMIAGTGGVGFTNNTLYDPAGLARDSSSGNLFIADTKNHRVMMYRANASSGTVVAGGNGPGTNVTQLYSPFGFAFDSSSNSLVIANYNGHNIVRWILGASSWTLVAGSISRTSGSSSTLLNSPIGVTLDSTGNIYVADSANHRIQFFLAGQSNGTTIAGITGSSGTTSSLLNTPYWVILDNQMNLYVSDRSNNRVQKFYSIKQEF